MIWGPDGQEYGTAAELAERLTKRDPHTGRVLERVTPGMVRSWHYSHGLTKRRMRDENGRPQVVFPYVDAAVCCRRTADTPQGRTRQLDLQPA